MKDLSILDSSILHKVLQERRSSLPFGKAWLSASMFVVVEGKDHYTSVAFKKNDIQYQLVIEGRSKPIFTIYISNMTGEHVGKWMHEHLPNEVYWESFIIPEYVISEESFFQYTLCKDMKEMTPEEFMHCYMFCKTFNEHYPYWEYCK